MIGYTIIDDCVLEIETVDSFTYLYNDDIRITKYDPIHIRYSCNNFRLKSIKNIFTHEYLNKIKFNGNFINYTKNLSENIDGETIRKNDFIDLGDIVYIEPYTSYITEYFLSENDAINYEYTFENLSKKYKELNINFCGVYTKYNFKNGFLFL